MPSQGKQDEWVLSILGMDRPGFFVDVGAGDPYEDSNTHLLRHAYGWRGVAIEPRLDMYQKLLDIPAVQPVHAVVSPSFKYSPYNRMARFYRHKTIPTHSTTRSPFISKALDYDLVQVPQYSLYKILNLCDAPKTINYLSLDVEGDELQILNGFPFSEYCFECITVEHNQNEQDRSSIHNILVPEGYQRVEGPPGLYWDDCYVHNSVQS